MFREVLRRLIPIVKPPEALIEKTVSIHEKIRHIRDWLKSREPVSFDRVLEMAQNRARDHRELPGPTGTGETT